MSIIASCGHTLTEEEGMGTMIKIPEVTRDGTQCTSYPVVCNKCLKWYKENVPELIIVR